MKKQDTQVLVAVGLLALAGACAEAPTDAVDAVRARVDAVSAEGQIYAADEYATARDAIGRLDSELQAQADRFALTRSYDRTTELVAEVEQAADAVQRVIENEKDRLRADTSRLLADATGTLDQVRTAIEELSDEQAEGFRNNIGSVEASLGAIAADLQDGELAGAHDAARSALAATRDIGNALASMTAPDEAVVDQDAVMRAVMGGFDLPRRALATDVVLEAGPYRVRLTDESAPVVDEEPATTTRWVELRHEADGTLAGRALATVVPDSEIDQVTQGWTPRNQVRVDELLGGDYVRVWLNRDGASYLVHLPTSVP